jgi:hypothetical protein
MINTKKFSFIYWAAIASIFILIAGTIMPAYARRRGGGGGSRSSGMSRSGS